jgi:hypothetical protein
MGDVLASGQLSFLAQQISGTGAYLHSTNGDISFRSSGDILFDVASVLNAPNGSILTTAGGHIEMTTSDAGQRVDARALGEVQGNAMRLSAAVVRLHSASGSISNFLLSAQAVYSTTPQGTVSVLDSDNSDEEDLFRRIIFGEG